MQIRNDTEESIIIPPGESIPVVARTSRGSYGDGIQEVAIEESYADRPPREPIRRWVETNASRLGLDSEDGVDAVTDQILEAIERAGDPP